MNLKIFDAEDYIKGLERRETKVTHREKLADAKFENAFNIEQGLQDKKEELLQLKQDFIKGTKKIDVSDVL